MPDPIRIITTVNEGSSSAFDCYVRDRNNDLVYSDNVDSAVMTLYNKADKSVINDQEDIDISSLFNADGDVSCTIVLTPDDNCIVDTTSNHRYETHSLFLKVVTLSPACTITEEIEFKVRNLTI